ncbi:hypothetical protein E2C01_067160 [Portunus trituberculatus]|uniref:Uncharacterized protein n=1 Tax=Portunus trituberculatus TaxID=210409 RepID=A0A5B7HSW2_PORTR|nr:hypothetical protein [Portunus trituberculatus]
MRERLARREHSTVTEPRHITRLDDTAASLITSLPASQEFTLSRLLALYLHLYSLAVLSYQPLHCTSYVPFTLYLPLLPKTHAAPLLSPSGEGAKFVYTNIGEREMLRARGPLLQPVSLMVSALPLARFLLSPITCHLSSPVFLYGVFLVFA